MERGEQLCALFRGQPGRGDAQQVVGEAVFLARGVGLHEFPSAAHHVVERLYPRIEEQSVACGVCQVVVFQDFGLLPEIEQHAVVAVRGQVVGRDLAVDMGRQRRQGVGLDALRRTESGVRQRCEQEKDPFLRVWD